MGNQPSVPTTTKVDKPVVKAERKKPVRKAPVQKDYPNKLAWLKAMTEFEEKQANAETTAKVARLDKRIKSAQATADEATAKVAALKAERNALVPAEEEPADAGMSEDEHLAAEGQA